jgi:hypothetical protein
MTDSAIIEQLLLLAIEQAKEQGFSIVADCQTTISFDRKECCPLGACYAVAGKDVETAIILEALGVSMGWAVSFTLGFDGIVPYFISNKEAYELGKKLRIEIKGKIKCE